MASTTALRGCTSLAAGKRGACRPPSAARLPRVCLSARRAAGPLWAGERLSLRVPQTGLEWASSSRRPLPPFPHLMFLLPSSSISETFTLDLGGPQPISQVLSHPAGTELVVLEVNRNGGMGMVLEEVVEKIPEGKVAQSVRVVDSRTADRKQVTPTKGAAAQVSTVVVEVGEGSNAAAAGVKEGDKIRCFTAVFTVTDPIDIVSYYGNPPKKENRRGIFVADGQPFDKVMTALASNSQKHATAKEGVYEVPETVVMVVERSA